MGETSIAWTNWTWNPLRGCLEISPGCAFCYAAAYAARFSGPGQPYEGLAYFDANGKAHWTGRLRMVPEKLDEPMRKRKPQMVFVNSMSDLFHEDVPDEFIAAVFAVMGIAARHTYQVLTKRAERMADVVSRLTFDDCVSAFCRQCPRSIDLGFAKPAWPLPNVWLGVSAEDQRRADERIPHLLRTPAAVRFVSYEPALGPVRLPMDNCHPARPGDPSACGVSSDGCGCRLDWVIVGGESGRNARPFEIDWARSVIRQCRDTGTACFVKQLGAVPIGHDGETSIIGRHESTFGNGAWRRLDDHKGGNMEEWPDDLRVREFPDVAQVAGVQGSLF